jgi:hypothetical protein
MRFQSRVNNPAANDMTHNLPLKGALTLPNFRRLFSFQF